MTISAKPVQGVPISAKNPKSNIGRNMIGNNLVSPKIFIVRDESRKLENFIISSDQDHDIMIKERREGENFE